MKQLFIAILGMVFFCSCLKDDHGVDVDLYIKTPFHKGELRIKQNGTDWFNNKISLDSLSGVFAYGVEDGVYWNITVFKDSAYYQSEPAMIRLVYNRDTSISYIYFDSLTTSVSKEFHISK